MNDAAPLSANNHPHHGPPPSAPFRPQTPQSSVACAAERLVIDVDGPPVIISARVASILVRRAGLLDYMRRHRGDDPQVDAALLALTRAALTYRNRLSANGHQVAPTTVTEARCVLTTARAADRLRSSPRTITRAIHNGQLSAHRAGRIWLIDESDFDDYAERYLRRKTG